MDINYTQYNEKSIFDYSLSEEEEDAINYLNSPDNFRPFKQGLTELLIKSGFHGDTSDTEALSQYLISKLAAIYSTITPQTVFSWFSGEHRPKVEPGSRERMYEICFALHLPIEDVRWFFHHVYYDRAFNCHTYEEAIYYYCFLHTLDYNTAKKLIHTVETSSPSQDFSDTENNANYTTFVQNQAEECSSTEEFLHFLIENKNSFTVWNQSAISQINSMLEEIIGSDDTKPLVKNLKKSINTLIEKHENGSSGKMSYLNDTQIATINQCGLLIRELYEDANDYASSSENLLYDMKSSLDKRNPFTISFMLDRILTTMTGFSKKCDVPYIVKNNFPSKKTLSDILSDSKNGTLKLYDSIRKILILLNFYIYWCNIRLTPVETENSDINKLSEIYRDEADYLLESCGYEPLFAGNPYDWLFLCASKNEQPLSFFRSCMLEILL